MHSSRIQHRILGMTLKQFGALAALAVGNLVIIVIAAWFLLSGANRSAAPEPTIVIPTLRPSLTPGPPPTPTPMPDFSGARLILEDFPSGFQEVHPSELGLEQIISNTNYLATIGFGFVNTAQFENVIGYTLVLPGAAEQKQLDAELTEPRLMLDAVVEGLAGPKLLERSSLNNLGTIGDRSVASTLVADMDILQPRIDIVTFRRGPVMGIVGIIYLDGEAPPVKIDELARKLDSRIVEILATGAVSVTSSTPPPEPAPLPDFSTAILTLQDLPAGFEPVPEEELAEMEVTDPESAIGEMVAFGFQKLQAGQVDIVFGFTMSLPGAYTQNVSQAAVKNPEGFLKILRRSLELTLLAEWQALPNADNIGDNSTGWFLVGETYNGPIRADILIMRRGPALGMILAMKMGGATPGVDITLLGRKLDLHIVESIAKGPKPTP
jgi:hypothetical protein